MTSHNKSKIMQFIEDFHTSKKKCNKHFSRKEFLNNCLSGDLIPSSLAKTIEPLEQIKFTYESHAYKWQDALNELKMIFLKLKIEQEERLLKHHAECARDNNYQIQQSSSSLKDLKDISNNTCKEIDEEYYKEKSRHDKELINLRQTQNTNRRYLRYA